MDFEATPHNISEGIEQATLVGVRQTVDGIHHKDDVLVQYISELVDRIPEPGKPVFVGFLGRHLLPFVRFRAFEQVVALLQHIRLVFIVDSKLVNLVDKRARNPFQWSGAEIDMFAVRRNTRYETDYLVSHRDLQISNCGCKRNGLADPLLTNETEPGTLLGIFSIREPVGFEQP